LNENLRGAANLISDIPQAWAFSFGTHLVKLANIACLYEMIVSAAEYKNRFASLESNG
jgi:hypothetical protein